MAKRSFACSELLYHHEFLANVFDLFHRVELFLQVAFVILEEDNMLVDCCVSCLVLASRKVSHLPNFAQVLRSFTWGQQWYILLITFPFMVSFMLSLSSFLTTSSKVSTASLFTKAITNIIMPNIKSTLMQSNP